MRRFPRIKAALCTLVLAGISVVSPAPASAQAALTDEMAGRVLHLEVHINDRAPEFIARFVDIGGGVMLADAGELANIGIRPLVNGRPATGDIRLDRIDGVSYALDEPGQSIHISVSEATMAARVISAAPRTRDVSPEEIHTGFGLVLNYSLAADLRHSAVAGGVTAETSGHFDGRVFTPVGSFNHGFNLSYQPGETLRYRRLESYWRTPFPGRTSQIQFGDISTRGPNWSRPVRMGGILLERNFDLRPDLITIAQPGFEGTAAIPSTVEVYTDSLLRFSTQVPAGPFELRDLPVATGSGEVELLLRDTTGQERRVSRPFLVSPDLMRPGLLDYSLAIGYPRLGIGTDSDQYSPSIYGMGSLRFGVTEGLTLAAHAEFGDGLGMGGLSATFRVGTVGTMTASLAHSVADMQSGNMAELSGQMILGGYRLSGRIMRQSGEFFDIARHSAITDPNLAEPITALNQLSLSLPVTGSGSGGTSAFYADTWRADGQRNTSIGLSHSRPFMDRGSINYSAAAVQGETSELVLAIGVSMPLGARRHAGARSQFRNGAMRTTVHASGHGGDRHDGWHWRAQATREAQTSVAARAARNHQFGRIELAGRAGQGEQSVGLRAEGAVAVAGGGIFLSRRIPDAFAVVNAGAPDVEVRLENRSIGRTGASGRLLVPGLRSYQMNRLSIDPTNLPLDAHIPQTREIIRPALRSGATVDFGIEAAPASALVALVDGAGRPIEVGMTAILQATGESFLVGYDGQVYLRGLTAENEIIVRYPDNRTCQARFPYRRMPDTITRIEAITCQ